MTITYYDRLNSFYEFNAQNPSPSSAQLVLLHLMHLDNCHGRTGKVICTDRHLMYLTGLSKGAITDAKRYLKNSNFLDFKTEGAGRGAKTLYTLTESWVKNGQKTPTQDGHLVGDKRAFSGRLAGINEAENRTTTGISAPLEREKEGEKEAFTTITATARANLNEAEDSKESRRLISENSEEVKQAWFECEGEKLKGGVAYGLIGLEKTYGAKVVVDAIYRAHQANSQPRLSFNFVKAVLERTMKGGEKGSGKIVPIRAGTNNAAVVSDYAGAWDFNDEMPPDYDG